MSLRARISDTAAAALEYLAAGTAVSLHTPIGDDVDLGDTIPAPGPSPEESAVAEERRKLLEESVRLMPEARQEIVMLHLDGWQPSAIAERTGLSRSGVYYHLEKAAADIRAHFEKPHSARKKILMRRGLGHMSF